MTATPLARIVLVDDCAHYRQLLALYLDASDIVVVTEAANGAAGLDAVVEQSPDLVITDLQMPGTDGLWLAAKLQAEHPDVSVVMVTSRAGVGEVQDRAAAVGVSALVDKTAGPRSVVTAVKDALARRAA